MRSFLKWLAVVLFALGVQGAAQVTVGVDPITKIYSASPGETITQVLTIYNPNKTTANIRVAAYLSDMNMSEVGEISYPPAGTVTESLAAWTTFSPSEVTLASESSAQVRYTIKVPANATPGTHWAMLMFEGQDPNPQPGQTLTAFRMRVAHTMYVNVQPTKFHGEIVGIFENPPKVDTDSYDLGVQYSNSGNVATGVKGRIELRDSKGELVATLPIPLTLALPGRTILLKASWGGPVPKGQYSALVVLRDSDTTRDLVSDHVLNIPFDLVEKQPTQPAQVPAPGGKP